MPTSKSGLGKSASSIATAAEKTRSAIQDLQARLSASQHGSAGAGGSAASKAGRLETEEELERELAAYFAQADNLEDKGPVRSSASNTPTLDELRRRVIEGVVERILAEWTRDRSDVQVAGVLGNEVMEQLIERVLQQVGTVNAPKVALHP